MYKLATSLNFPKSYVDDGQLEGLNVKSIILVLLTSSLSGCVLQAQSVFIASSPVLAQDSSYSIHEEQVSWNGIRAEFHANNDKRLRVKAFQIGKPSDWVDSPAYIYGGKTPFAISMWVDLGELEDVLMDIGAVELSLHHSKKLSPTSVSVEATGGRSVCYLLASEDVKYSQPVAMGVIALADLPQRYGTWGCIRFIFDVPVDAMDPSKKFSLTTKFIVNDKEQFRTIHFGLREFTIVNR